MSHPSPTLFSRTERPFWRQRLNNPCFSFSTLFFMVLPLALLMLAIGLTSGFRGESIHIWHHDMRLFYPALTRLFRAVSTGAAWVLYLVYAILLVHAVARKNRHEQAFIARFAFCLALVLSLAGILKITLGMPRPGVDMPAAPFSFMNDFVSFPSGHTVQIVTAAFPLAFYFGRTWLFIAMSLLVTLIGYSRLWLGMHHPIDVLGGILVGSLIVVLIFRPKTGKNRLKRQ
ncbi:phosphatase PAP2 family protein [Oxalobacter sp. OttesenSCG-928-P03]|nr:phosphatase PAP2 family protein [Oxalobacter sp. OttesenSCG-928-P03]